jgi:hypothetical protein
VIRISTNERYQPASWWREAFLRRDTCPLACRPLILAMLRDWEVTVTEEEAEAFRAWGAQLPGWNGPDGQPFTFTTVEPSAS